MLYEFFNQFPCLVSRLGCRCQLFNGAYPGAFAVDNVVYSLAVAEAYSGILQFADSRPADDFGVYFGHAALDEQESRTKSDNLVGHRGALCKVGMRGYGIEEVCHAPASEHNGLAAR